MPHSSSKVVALKSKFHLSGRAISWIGSIFQLLRFGVVALTNGNASQNVSVIWPFSEIFGHQVCPHAEADADHFGPWESGFQVSHHKMVVASVAIVEDPWRGDRQRLQRADMIQYSDPESLKLCMVGNSSDVNGFAGIANPGTNSQRDIICSSKKKS